MRTTIKYSYLALFLLILSGANTVAQEIENKFQSRSNFDISFKPLKKIKLTLTPELRFDEDFSLDKYLIEGELEYKAFKQLTLGATYGFVSNLRKEKSTEYFNRYAFSTTLSKELMRFEPSFRLMYSNYADDEISDKKFLRYRAKLKYDIRDCKITPFAAIQLFQDLNEGQLHKTRYTTGINYKLLKNNYLQLSYKLDYYKTEYLNKHIISFGYKLKF